MFESSKSSGPAAFHACTPPLPLVAFFFFLLMGLFRFQSLIFVGSPGTDDTLDRDPLLDQYLLSAPQPLGLVLRTTDKGGSKTPKNTCSPVVSSSGGDS